MTSQSVSEMLNSFKASAASAPLSIKD